MTEPIYEFSLIKNNGEFIFKELKTGLVNQKIDSHYISTDIQNFISIQLNGIDQFIDVELPDQIITNLRDLKTGSLSIIFKINKINLKGISPLFYFGVENQCSPEADHNGHLILEVGHFPIRKGDRSLYYTTATDECKRPTYCFDSKFDIEENKWYHFIVTVDKEYSTGYLNGEEIINRRYNFGLPENGEFFEHARGAKKLWIGKANWYNDKEQYLDGNIGKIEIYETVLTSDDVKLLYSKMTMNDN